MKATKKTTSLWDFYAITSVTYIAVAWCRVCDKTLILRNIGSNALINLAFVAGAKRGGRGGRTPATQATVNSEMTTPPPPPPFPARSFVNSVVRGGSAPRGQVQPLTPGRPGPWPRGGVLPYRPFSAFVGLYSLGELASMLQGFYRDRDTQLRFPPNYIENAF